MWGLTVDVANRLTSIPGAAPGPGYPPNSGLSSKLQLAATLLSAGLGTRIVTIDWGSFDTHGDQLAGQDPQLTTLSRALAAFKADLAARGVEQNVITMVFSEFGRRLEESDSAGTDHRYKSARFRNGFPSSSEDRRDIHTSKAGRPRFSREAESCRYDFCDSQSSYASSQDSPFCGDSATKATHRSE